MKKWGYFEEIRSQIHGQKQQKSPDLSANSTILPLKGGFNAQNHTGNIKNYYHPIIWGSWDIFVTTNGENRAACIYYWL